MQGGWTEISTVSARRAVNALGVAMGSAPISRATDGVRATAGFGLTLFNGFVHIGVARAIDKPSGWKFAAGVGPLF